MFSERDLSRSVATVRESHAPNALVLDVTSDFETLPPAHAEDLGLLVDRLDPITVPDAWLPTDPPEILRRYAGGAFTIGLPGDGSVVWTRQTEPPVLLVKSRVRGSPESFVDFLIATALVEVGLETTVPDTDERAPEHFLGFFRETYPELAAAVPLSPNGTYQIGAALYDAWIGLHTRDTLADWLDDPSCEPLGAAWQDAGDRLAPRIDGLPGEVARGETDFADATELACAAVKHALELPAPFAALDTAAYAHHGPPYAVKWAEKTFDALTDDDD